VVTASVESSGVTGERATVRPADLETERAWIKAHVAESDGLNAAARVEVRGIESMIEGLRQWAP
jgi:hypothetical protein